jgi:FkbM family methyltransferase
MIREHFVGTRLGSLLLFARDKVDLMVVTLRRPETVGTVYNDQLVLRLAVDLCDPRGIFADVGAHIGSVSAAMLRRHRAARVIAFEAIPDKAARLKRRLPSIVVHCCAVAEKSGRAKFFIDTDQSGCSSLLDVENAEEIEVELAPLDALLPSDGVSVIKIDVEGSELGVLLGADSVSSRSRPVIVFESGPNDNGDKERIWDWFAKRDYAVCAPNRVAHHDDGMSLECFLDSHRYPRYTTNYVAIPREKRLDVRARARKSLGLPPD